MTDDNIFAALARAQGAMKAVAFDCTNPHFRSRYASLAACVDAIRVPLAQNGLCWSATTEVTQVGTIKCTTTVYHVTGGSLSATLSLSPKDWTPQSVGAATTYARRYCLSMLLGLAADEDDDGNGAQATQTVQTAQPHPVTAEHDAIRKLFLACAAEIGEEAARKLWRDTPSADRPALFSKYAKKEKEKANE